MMKNRKLPFGYKMVKGEVVTHPDEAKVVHEIFKRYLEKSASLQSVADALREQDVPYTNGQIWNKHMVSRILADERYTGKDGYPKLVESNDLERIALKRAQQAQPPPSGNELSKAMRKLCRRAINKPIEQQVKELIHDLAQIPSLIQCPPENDNTAPSILQAEISKAMDQCPTDENESKCLLLQAVAEQYGTLKSEEYETTRIRHLLTTVRCEEDITPNLLEKTVSEIITERGKVKLRMRNGQIIEKGASRNE